MDLIVNGLPVAHGSRGTRRYYSSIMKHLNWPSRVEVSPVPRLSFLRRAHELAIRGRPDAIFWSPAQRGPLRAHHHVVTVLDCINVEFMHRGDWRLPAYRALFTQILAGAEAVVTISRATRDTLLRLYTVDEAKVAVISSGCDLPGPAEMEEPVPRASSAEKPFVLMVTNSLAHKNTLEACRALATSRAASWGVGLTIVGSAAPGAVEACRSVGVEVTVHTYVDDALLSRLYRSALFLFSPSLQEGYNLPVAEAVLRGGNVLCSDIPVHREYFEGKARMFDPTRREAMTAAIDEALDQAGRWFPASAGERPRTFEHVAADYRALFQRISREHGYAPVGAAPAGHG
jgi:glycosyltransferase involved in cell wall biosynthesis